MQNNCVYNTTYSTKIMLIINTKFILCEHLSLKSKSAVSSSLCDGGVLLLLLAEQTSPINMISLSLRLSSESESESESES